MIRSKLFAVLVALSFAIVFAGVSAEGAEKKASAKVKDGHLVSVHYTLTVDGEVVDSSLEGAPMELKIGSGQVIPGFEDALKGMKVGEKKSFKVSPKDGYGEIDPDALQEVARERMPKDTPLEVGMVLYAKGPDGKSFPATVAKITDETVTMDFNHPLAGKTLMFDVEIVSID